MSLTALAWLFTAGVLLHNLEEALFLPQWTHRAPSWPRPIEPRVFHLAVLLLSALILLLTTCATHARPQSPLAYLMSGYVLAMILNALVPHLFFSLKDRAYMPGTATALLFNIPLGLLFLAHALAEHHLSLPTLFWAAPLTSLAMLSLIPVLFTLTRFALGLASQE